MFTHFQAIEEWMQERKSLGVKPGLARMDDLLSRLDHPENRMKAVHVAGTNGKGSTIQMMRQALHANGYRVGVFNSSSLSGLTGHIWNNDQTIPHTEWIKLMDDIYPIIKQLDRKGDHPTNFEIITVVAFVYFSAHVDIALIETGMGGRYDTTNCLHPILSIITNIAKDHTAFLGNDRKDIAYHKAGIIKEHTPLVLGDVNDDIYPVFGHEATQKHANVYRLFHDFTYSDVNISFSMQHFQWKHGTETHDVMLSVDGKHQVKNASLAIMALSILETLGITLDWSKTLNAIQYTTIPARFETVCRDPLMIVDGAHNPAGVEAFLSTVGSIYPTEEKHLIFAAYADKDTHTMLDTLNPCFRSITLTTFKDERAATASYLYKNSRHPYKYAVSDWKGFIHNILKEATGTKKIYFVTGSLAFITEVRSYILKSR